MGALNEQVLAYALRSQRQNGDVPYPICTDLNVDPAKSQVRDRAVQFDMVYDVAADYFGGEPPPTSCKENIYEDMSGTGITRIDTIIAHL